MTKVFQRNRPGAATWASVIAWITCTAATPAAHASSFRAEVGYWDFELSGETVNGDALDFERDLDVETTEQDYQRLNFHIGPRWLPEIALGRHALGVRGERVIDVDILNFGDINLIRGETELDTFADLDDLSLTLRYPATLGERLRAHLGLTARRVDGPVRVEDPGPDGETEIDDLQELFPQLHLALDWQPVQALTLTAEGDWIEYQDDNAWQWRLAADWQILSGWGLSLGYHVRHFSVRGSDLALDADFEGAQLGLIYRWASR